MVAWDAALIDRIRAEVPRYKEAHTLQIINALKKLERGDVPLLQIMHGQMEDAIMATVHQYAMRRDAEDAAWLPPTQQALIEDETPPANQHTHDGAGPKRKNWMK